MEEIEEAREIIAKYEKHGRRDEDVYEDWLVWENKVIANHYDEIEEMEEEEE